MAPSVFVSSTYVDLKHVREHVGNFIESMGFVPNLFEKGGVGFDWHKPIDESCVDAVKECDMFVLILGGRYGSPTTDHIRRTAKRYDSVTRREYKTARIRNIPIFVFVDSRVLAEYATYRNNKNNKSVHYASVDSILMFDLLDDIYRQTSNNYVHSFANMAEITQVLKQQWAAMLQTFVKERSRQDRRNLVRLNSLKLFYFRKRSKKSTNDVAKSLKITRHAYSRLEVVKTFQGKGGTSFDGYHDRYFPECDFRLIQKLERLLSCPGALSAGQHDDFLAHYVEFYNEFSGKKVGKRARAFPFLPFRTKMVVFDFDGTISRHASGRSTWEMIWEHLGYSINECAEHHTRFRAGAITHEEWCNITLKRFQQKGLKKSALLALAKNLEIVPGFTELVCELQQRGIKMHIVSGSIRHLIQEVLGPLAAKFENIKANEMDFARDGTVKAIIGTRYDFQGKADYIKNLVLERKCSPMDVLFVGNAGNDRWVANAGVRTLCVNPTSTDPDNPKHWTANIRMMKDMREVLPYV